METASAMLTDSRNVEMQAKLAMEFKDGQLEHVTCMVCACWHCSTTCLHARCQTPGTTPARVTATAASMVLQSTNSIAFLPVAL